VSIVRLLNDWPPGRERRAAFAEAVSKLAPWPMHYRSTPSFEVVDVTARRVRDTLGLAREVVDSYPDDTARDAALPSRLILGSELGGALDSFVLRKASFSLEALGRGPGGAALKGLELNDSLPRDPPWSALGGWPGWGTLEVLHVLQEPTAATRPELWRLLDGATLLHELHLNGTSTRVLERLRDHPEVARRLDALSLQHCSLGDASLDVLAAMSPLEHLIRLDLRHNRLAPQAVERLRRAPHFARTTILTDP
jgi:hypothetical protein